MIVYVFIRILQFGIVRIEFLKLCVMGFGNIQIGVFQCVLMFLIMFMVLDNIIICIFLGIHSSLVLRFFSWIVAISIFVVPLVVYLLIFIAPYCDYDYLEISQVYWLPNL